MTKTPFDPEAVPIDSVAGEEGVPPEHLEADWLRNRFAQPPSWSPEITDEQRQRQRMNAPMVHASVLMPIIMRADGAYLLLTQRAAHLNDYAGQISLPGGRMEPADASPIITALRETEEEVGLHRRHVEVIGVLPEYWTGSGYRITPVVGIVRPPFELRADPFEVAEIIEVPLSFLMDGKNHQRRTAVFPGGQRTFYAIEYRNCFIWGATAAMLRNLYHFLRA